MNVEEKRDRLKKNSIKTASSHQSHASALSIDRGGSLPRLPNWTWRPGLASSRQQWVRANSLETFHFLREPLTRRGARWNYTIQGEQCRIPPLIFYGNLLIDRVWQYGGRPNGRKMDGITFNWIISNVLRAGDRASTVLLVLEPGLCSNLPLSLFPVPRPFQIARFSARDSICTGRTHFSCHWIVTIIVNESLLSLVRIDISNIED